MRKLLVVIVLLLVTGTVLGFYRGWFRLSTGHADQQPSATFTVDQNKINEDKDSVKDRVQEFRHKTPEETTGGDAEEVK